MSVCRAVGLLSREYIKNVTLVFWSKAYVRLRYRLFGMNGCIGDYDWHDRNMRNLFCLLGMLLMM